mmetsp:Transcript_3328/g.5209  ORF Transcript_3328/g.5209 Transcript_3328/m.5209 type:complete len:604 (-) Transcript_3328:144-1955(-)
MQVARQSLTRLRPSHVRGMATEFAKSRKYNAIIVHKNGRDILKDTWYNKGTAFSRSERDRLGLRGLLPPRRLTIEQQLMRFLKHFREPGMTPIEKYLALVALQDRNETLFYKAVIENIREMAPIVYTPTVGIACQHYSSIFRQPRGMFFSLDDRKECLPIVYNWPSDHVDIIVVTDGSRILGLGDLGVQGMAISVGKLVLYVAAGGINPVRTLPVCIDAGTNNISLLNSPLYVGTPTTRGNDKDYFELLDEFMESVYYRWPNVLVQFEDFQNERAVALLNKYRNKRLCFNDDIQGTGAVTVSGIICTLRARGLEFKDLINDRIVILGAGSAGIGVATALLNYMVIRCGVTHEEAAKRFWLVDDKGLLTRAREGQEDEATGKGRLFPGQKSYLRPEVEQEGAQLMEVVQSIKPTILLGLSGVGGLFTEEICREMGKHNKKPVIFAMSNPSDNAECSAETAFRATEGRAIFASGSPFDDVTLPDGRICKSNQANNMFIFPGLGLGAVLGYCKVISDGMILSASEALAEHLDEEEVRQGMVYPDVETIRDVSLDIAVAVLQQAREEDNIDERFIGMSTKELRQYVKERMYNPEYPTVVYRPPGIGE